MEPVDLSQLSDIRYKHFKYRAQLAANCHLEATTLRNTPVIVTFSKVEAEMTLPIHWTLVVCKEGDGDIIFSNAVRKDWVLEHHGSEVCVKTECQFDSDCSHEVRLGFDADVLSNHFHEKLGGAIAACEIGSGRDDTMEQFVDDLLILVSDTAEMEDIPWQPVSLIVLEGSIPATSRASAGKASVCVGRGA
ncbi:hypothetical protein GSI_09326 [Ganoderma sinense ZZ0214-1]|uniref:Uncharacterized protein n=1 Tax=Ganoderma sinense ZZ0214-1 TaxID=1077348 RepID=A0A2G8S674_9APHY|nr:hypothetical protein GSI_09326 [Ganoderma sinense ZZ0214-1]